MTRIWSGPCEALKKAQADPLWAAMHRRNGRLGVACTIEPDGRSGDFYEVVKRRGEWYRHDLGRVSGENPFIVTLNGSHRFTPFDAELRDMHYTYLDRLAGDVEEGLHDLVKAADGAADDLAEVLTHVRA